MNKNLRFRAHRAGWSYFQVVAILVAAGAGVWLGAYYVGVQVEDLAYTALDESTLLEKLPDDWRPPTPPGLVKDPEQERLKAEQMATELKQDLSDLQRQVTDLKSSTQAPLESVAVVETESAADDGVAQDTLEYWTGLAKIAGQVQTLITESDLAVDELNAGRLLEIRLNAYRYGAKAISALPTEGVDPQAIEFGQSLENWFGSGVDLYATSLSVWRGELDGQEGVGGAAGLTSRQQFDKQLALLRANSAEFAQRLKRRHGVGFMPIEL